jgi:hypothetical protein
MNSGTEDYDRVMKLQSARCIVQIIQGSIAQFYIPIQIILIQTNTAASLGIENYKF